MTAKATPAAAPKAAGIAPAAPIPPEILRILPAPYDRKLSALPEALAGTVEEIRIAIGRPVAIRGSTGEYLLTGQGMPVPDEEMIEQMLRALTENSFYSWENQLRQGYLTLPGGHRVGICGKTDLRQGTVVSMQDISSVNIRRARQISGVSEKIIPFCLPDGRFQNTLIVSPPKKGKTTLLRDMIRCLSLHGCWVGVADERSEIAGMERGRCSFDLGPRSDVIDGCPKDEAIKRLIRTMGPDIVATDEIGSEADRCAIEEALLCGVKILATIHAETFGELEGGAIRSCIREGGFQRLIFLSDDPKVGTIRAITDHAGRAIFPPEAPNAGEKNRIRSLAGDPAPEQVNRIRSPAAPVGSPVVGTAGRAPCSPDGPGPISQRWAGNP